MLLNTSQTVALLALLGSSAAQTSIITVLLASFDQQAIEASVVAAVPEATTYVINCPSGTPSDECGLGRDLTIVNGPSTWEMHATQIEGLTLDAECDVVFRQEATCTQSMSGGESSSMDPSFATQVLTDIAQYYVPITVTAGLEKLDATPGASTTTPPQTTTTGAGENAAPTTTTSTPNAAFPQNTQNALLAGVAAIVGGVLML